MKATGIARRDNYPVDTTLTPIDKFCWAIALYKE